MSACLKKIKNCSFSAILSRERQRERERDREREREREIGSIHMAAKSWMEK